MDARTTSLKQVIVGLVGGTTSSSLELAVEQIDCSPCEFVQVGGDRRQRGAGECALRNVVDSGNGDLLRDRDLVSLQRPERTDAQ